MNITIKIHGPRGVGKTTIAKVIHKALKEKGINPHISEAVSINWISMEPPPKLDGRIVLIDEVDESIGISDDEICRQAVKKLLTQTDLDHDIKWPRVEKYVKNILDNNKIYKDPHNLMELAARVEHALHVLGYGSLRPKPQTN